MHPLVFVLLLPVARDPSPHSPDSALHTVLHAAAKVGELSFCLHAFTLGILPLAFLLHAFRADSIAEHFFGRAHCLIVGAFGATRVIGADATRRGDRVGSDLADSAGGFLLGCCFVFVGFALGL